MPLEYTLFAILITAFVVWLIRLKQEDERARTLEEVWFANVNSPQFYEQRDPTMAAAESAIKEYEHACKMLEECGNKAIGAEYLHLWIFRATDQNERIEFSMWQALNIENRRVINEAFTAEKTRRTSENEEYLARYVWGFENNDTSQIKK